MSDCLKRAQMGSLMGASVGACIGIIFGTMSVFKYGHGGVGYLNTVGKMVVQSGASFGLFMGIGAFIRCEDDIGALRQKPYSNDLLRAKGSIINIVNINK